MQTLMFVLSQYMAFYMSKMFAVQD